MRECDYGSYSQSYFLMFTIFNNESICFGNQNKTIKIRGYHKKKKQPAYQPFPLQLLYVTESKIPTTTARALGELAPRRGSSRLPAPAKVMCELHAAKPHVHFTLLSYLSLHNHWHR